MRILKKLFASRAMMTVVMGIAGSGAIIALANHGVALASVLAAGFAACSYRLSTLAAAQESGMTPQDYLRAQSQWFGALTRRQKLILLFVAACCAIAGVIFLANIVSLMAELIG